VQEVPDLAVRLQIEHPALYEQYDRTAAEAEFRTSISAPILAFIAFEAIEPSRPALLTVAVVPVLLFWSGVLRTREAQDYVIGLFGPRHY
jgi:hypothetical protein